MNGCSQPRVIALVVASFVVLSIPAHGQAPAEPPPRLEASAQFAFLSTTGNASTQSLGAGGDVVWRPARWIYTGKIVFAQNEADTELTARSFAGLLRASRTINERLSAYGQYDYLRDVFAGVEQRHVMEGGAAFLAVDQPRQRLRFDTGLGYLHERGPDDDLDSATWSAAAAYRVAVSATSDLTFEPRYLLTLADTGAWKYDQAAALTVAINSLLSLKLSHTIRYAAAPPVGFKNTDTIMAVSIVAKGRRPN